MTRALEALRPALDGAACQLGLALSTKQSDALLAYLALLQRWNAAYNLTAIRDPSAMLVQHVVDCLAVIAPLDRHRGDRSLRLLDVGSGGGLPGIVIAILLPSVTVTCIDTVGKKAAFLVQAAAELRLSNLTGVQGRVETLRDRNFNVIVSRAFASLAEFVRLSRSALREGGVWMAMKGKVPTLEISALTPEVEVFHVEHLIVPELHAERCVIWMKRAPSSPSL